MAYMDTSAQYRSTSVISHQSPGKIMSIGDEALYNSTHNNTKLVTYMGDKHAKAMQMPTDMMKNTSASREDPRLKSRAGRHTIMKEIRAGLDRINCSLYQNFDQNDIGFASQQMAAVIMGDRFRRGTLLTSYLNGLAVNDHEIVAYNHHVRGRMEEILGQYERDVAAGSVDPEEERPVPHALPEAYEWEQLPAPGEETEYNFRAKQMAKELLAFPWFRSVNFAEGYVAAPAPEGEQSQQY